MRHFIVTDHQAGKLPRWALLLLCALYVFPGLIGREPWRTGDAPGFGAALTMLRGHWGDWLVPNVAGQVLTDDGPLAYALLAGISKVLVMVFGQAALYAPWPHWAAMMTAALGLLMMLGAFWYAAYALASRPGLQPLDPFGAAASRIDFARAIADTALLVLIATLGLLVRMHEIGSISALVSWVSLYLWAVALSLESPRRGGVMAGLACAAIFATRSPVLSLALALSLLLLTVWVPAFRLVRRKLLLSFLAPWLAGIAVWPLLLVLTLPGQAPVPSGALYFEAWMSHHVLALAGPSPEGLLYLLRTVFWFFWPAWPLAAYSLWRWRDKLSEPSIAMPFTILAVMALLWLLNPNPGEAHLAVAAPVMALMAAPGLATMRRSLVNMIDWFAVTCFSLLGLVLWLYWLALITGTPDKVAFRATQFAPGFMLGPIWQEIVLGGLASACWLLLVRWRVSRQPPMIWRAVVLSASGLTLVWFLLMTLWLPVLNERMGFRSTAMSLAAAHLDSLGKGLGNRQDCAHSEGLALAPRAAFFYYSQIRFAPDREACSFTLEQTRPDAPLRGEFGQLIWRGAVSAYREDEFRLYRQIGLGMPR